MDGAGDLSTSAAVSANLPTQTTEEIAAIEAALENLSFSEVEYWRNFYKLEKYPYDWYNNFEELRSVIEPPTEKYKSKENFISLVVGCGNSDISKGLLSLGSKEVYSVDICDTVIDQMKILHKDQSGMHWIVMDVQKLIFPDSHFDVIVDKGTMDALLCQEGACAIVNRMLVEIDRVLKPGGTYILITMGRTARRIPFLKRSLFTWCNHIEQSSVHFPHQKDPTNIYLMRKPINSELHLRVAAPGKESPEDYPPVES